MPLGRIHEPSMDPPGPSMEQVHKLGHQNMHWVNEPVHGLLSINPQFLLPNINKDHWYAWLLAQVSRWLDGQK